METRKVGTREFRGNLADYLGSGAPLAITRHRETLGFYTPAEKRSRQAKLAAMRAARDLDEMIASWGAGEDELEDEYKEIRHSTREKRMCKAFSTCRGCSRQSGLSVQALSFVN